jgi:hypothetical protein
MTPDTRLFRCEFEATRLDSKGGEATARSRNDVLDRYQMLILPGSNEPVRTKTEMVEHQSRFWLYKRLSVAAETGEIEILTS